MDHARLVTSIILAGLVIGGGRARAATQSPAAPSIPTIEDKVASIPKLDGYVPLYWDERAGTLWMEISRFDTEFLYANGLTAGLGSNDIGLDRGQSGGGHLVRFERVGPKVMLVELNTDFRAVSDNADERRSVEDAFARSTLWGFTVAAETGGRVLVDATDFFLRDAVNVIPRLRPGAYRVDRTRSAIHMPQTKAFPKNTEVNVTLTFTHEPSPRDGGIGPPEGPTRPGGSISNGEGFGGGLSSGTVASVAPDADAVTLREHHSLVELPDSSYEPRESDPRDGYGAMAFQDYAVPLGKPMTKRYVRRHRLEKIDPAAKVSDVKAPIRYYLDRGTPEPMRSALLEGARWWNQAFEASGFRNAFQVEVLPEGADPMDIRYNVINWVHRSTRGWSSGATIVDPRTGEIIKATVTLGSLRVRQDYLIFEGLLSPYETGTETPPALAAAALGRLRQLAAHEVGHTLGLSHNYYDSSKGRISVMDYPHPLEGLRPDGSIDLSNAYAVGIGDWDKVTIAYGYQDFPRGADEKEALRSILDEAWSRDIRFMTNQDMEVSPKSDWWNNGRDMTEELTRLMKVRRAALDRFGENAIQHDAPMATMEEALVPIYLYHRWAVEAASSIVGGEDYIYALRGDGRVPFTRPSGAEQRAALDALAATLAPSELAMPKSVLDGIPPRPSGYGRHRELFPRTTGDAFDPISPAAIAADVTIGFVLEPDRAARVVAQHALDASLPGLSEVIDRMTKATFDSTAANGYEAELRRASERVLVDRLMWLAGRAPMAQVRAMALLKLQTLGERMKNASSPDEADRAGALLLANDITRFLERPSETVVPPYVAKAPPGAPIGGDGGMDWLAPVVWDCAGDDAPMVWPNPQ
jgi:Met-zincin/Domain of unknown function (DUF5117)